MQLQNNIISRRWMYLERLSNLQIEGKKEHKKPFPSPHTSEYSPPPSCTNPACSRWGQEFEEVPEAHDAQPSTLKFIRRVETSCSIQLGSCLKLNGIKVPVEPPIFWVGASSDAIPSPSWVLPLGLRSSNALQQGGLGFWASFYKQPKRSQKQFRFYRHETPEVQKALEGRSSIEINPAGFTTCLANSFTHTPHSGNSWLPYTSASTFSIRKSKWLRTSTKIQTAKLNLFIRPSVLITQYARSNFQRHFIIRNKSYGVGGSCKIWDVE